MKKNLAAAVSALSLTACIQAANAADISINGFASITAGRTFNQGNDFSSPTGKAQYFVDGANGGTYDDEISFKPDTLFGLQFSSDLGDGLRITGQMVAKGANDFDAEFTWLYVNYDFTPDLSIAVGRLGYPLYNYSDYLNVRYAYHWIRGPADTYTLPVAEFEGARLTQRYNVGDWDGTVQAFVGSYDSELNGFGGEAFKGENAGGLIATIGNDWLQLRALGLQQDTLNTNGLADGQEDDEVSSRFMAYSAKAELGSWLVMGEYTRYDFEDPIYVGVNPAYIRLHQGVSSYLTVAYRVGSFTPNITWSDRDIELALPGLKFNAKNETWTVGVRWDFHPQAALKVEYNMVSDESDDFYTTIAGNRFDVDNLAVGVDLVF